MRTFILLFLTAVLLCWPLGSRAEEPEPGSNEEEVAEPEPADTGYEEQVAVRAGTGEVTTAPIGTNSTRIDPAELPPGPAKLADIVVATPGVSENGQGGHLQVISIRGVSRQRVLNLVSGMRIVSDRRAGASLSFIEPRLLGSIEVLRGPETTFHGSGALGGVMQVQPQDFPGWTFEAGYENQGNENYQMVGTGGEYWSFGFARRDSGDGEAADGSKLNDHFTQYSAIARVEWGGRGLRYEFIAIPSYGSEIGKSNTDFPDRTTNYPRERHGLVKFAMESDRGWEIYGFVHPNDLETSVVEGQESSVVVNQAFDYGVGVDATAQVGEGISLHLGASGFGRLGVESVETSENLDPGNPVPFRERRTLDDAEEFEGGLYSTLKWNWGASNWEGGLRFSWIGQSNGNASTQEDHAWNGFLGAALPLPRGFELRGNLSSGLRFPSLAELYFSGTTGRGEVLGNPDLDPERSYNGELSLRWLSRSWLLRGGLFHNRITDYIERIEIQPDLLTFVNLTSGTLAGAELQAMYRPSANWRVDFGGHRIDGTAEDGSPLADVPPHEFFVGGGWSRGPWRVDTRLTHRSAIDDPASGEKAIPSAELLTAALEYGFLERWAISLAGRNLLNEEYFPSADNKAAPARGRSIAVRLKWQGKR